MRQIPTPEERLNNAALFLCLAEQLTKHGNLGDRWKVQKCAFLVALNQFEQRQKGFNLTFFRYKMGPMSKQIYDTVDMLKNAGLIGSKGLNYYLSEQGQSFVPQLCADVWADPRNEGFFDKFSEVGRKFGPMSGRSIKDYVYELTATAIGGPRQIIKDMPEGWDITQVLDHDEATLEIVIPQCWLETLAILVAPESREGIEKASNDMSSGRVRSHAEVWSSV